MLCKKHNISTPEIEYYINHRDEYLYKLIKNYVDNFPNNEKAFNPNFSVIVAFSETNFGGGHFGNVKEYSPKAKAEKAEI